MERDTIEQQLFTWETWDEQSTNNLSFEGVTLVTQIGEFPAGTKFQAAFMLNSVSLLVLVDDKEQEFAFELKLSVGSKVEMSEIQSCASDCECGHEH